MKTFCILMAMFAINASASVPCQNEIDKQDGYSPVTSEEKVFKAIYNSRERDEAKKAYWLTKTANMSLVAFKIGWSADSNTGEDLVLLDAKTCKKLAQFAIWGD